MQDYKILSCDLDGTLFAGGTNVSAENDRAMRDLADRGIVFVINTGRTYTEIPEAVRNHPAVCYIICSNGAAIYDKKNGTRTPLCMTKDTSNRVLDILFDYDVSVSLRREGVCYVDPKAHNDAHYAEHRASAAWREFFYAASVPRPHFGEFCREADEVEMTCAFFASDKERTEAAERLSHLEGVQLASTDPANLEVFSSCAGKGSALLHLAGMLGMTAADAVAVGDTANDSDMILKAGLGLAVGNAWPELKKQANAIICTNKEHIVPYIAEHYFSNQALLFKAFAQKPLTS